MLPPFFAAPRRRACVALAALALPLAISARSSADTPVADAAASPAASSAAPAATPPPPTYAIAWQEHFDKSLDWLDPFDHGAATLARVYSVKKEGDLSFLHARHDCTQRSHPPAMHYGHAFQVGAPPLEKVRALKWKWRALRQPNVDDDGWEDMAAGVYVVMKTPSLLVGGKGFKFGWLAKPGERGSHQHGLLQVQLRTDPVGTAWKSESVDLCAMFRREYGKCEGEHVLYVGVVSDSDGTKSVAEADYADFEIDVAR